jgi:hypothetical protein
MKKTDSTKKKNKIKTTANILITITTIININEITKR